MMNLLKKFTLSLTVLVMTASMALAGISLEAAKQQGLVGERPDGLLGIVSTAAPDVKSLVDTVNAERMEKYQSIAAKNGTPVTQVQALAGKKLIGAAAAGEYIMNASGGWQKK